MAPGDRHRSCLLLSTVNWIERALTEGTVAPDKFAVRLVCMVTLRLAFVVLCIVQGGALLSLYDGVAANLPGWFASWLFMAQFPLLVLAGFLEGKIPRSDSSGPMWMRISSRPVRVYFALALSYFALVLLQTWDIQVGPIDPTPPPSWPPEQRLRSFLMLSAAAYFPMYLIAATVLIPTVRLFWRPFRALPPAIGLLAAGLCSAALGYGCRLLLQSETIDSSLDQQQSWLAQHPEVAVAILLATTVLPAALPILRRARS